MSNTIINFEFKSKEDFVKKYAEYQKEIERLKEEYMILQNASDEVEEEKDREIERLNSIIKEVREFIEWHYEDNKKFYKNKGIGLNYPECDYILEILDKVDKENNNEQ